MSDWGWILAGGAAVTGFLGMFWGYVKSLWSQLASRLVMSCEIRGGLAEAVGMYFWKHFKVSCETCATPTSNIHSKRCDTCWIVEGNLPCYIKSPNGWEFVRKLIPKLDDWVDGHPDAWDYNKVLSDNIVVVEWCDQVIDGCGTVHRAGQWAGWSMCWEHGVIFIGPVSETIARKAAALFVSLWLRGVSASFADKLMAGFIWYLELEVNTRLTFLAETGRYSHGGPFMRLTREGFCTQAAFEYDVERKIMNALGTPKPDEEIIVTFTKRKKRP